MSRSRALDFLFEFDAPQTFMDLTAPLIPLPTATHDAWFDEVHPDHSRPSVELAREVADVVRRLQQQQEQKPHHVPRRKTVQPHDRIRNTANERTKKRCDASGVVHFGHLPTTARDRKPTNKRAEPELGRLKQDGQPAARAPVALVRRRQPLVDAGNRLNAGTTRTESSERTKRREVQEVVARHNKKFKATHTYEPPRHSVREVKQWERAMDKSYYALSAEERVQANKDIAIWKQRQKEKSI
ncbi:unnamed protein product [Hyaloperonospora brassicae]|uniref:Uncharacterized protein n=1 Tax=Hyaloperonospora brassicae TaxID=162125 RepID=A0AAV0UJ23_HYABA|nr:unnamed protein product [Hyaloperonospora brassicae]